MNRNINVKEYFDFYFVQIRKEWLYYIPLPHKILVEKNIKFGKYALSQWKKLL